MLPFFAGRRWHVSWPLRPSCRLKQARETWKVKVKGQLTKDRCALVLWTSQKTRRATVLLQVRLVAPVIQARMPLEHGHATGLFKDNPNPKPKTLIYCSAWKRATHKPQARSKTLSNTARQLYGYLRGVCVFRNSGPLSVHYPAGMMHGLWSEVQRLGFWL